MFTGRNRFETVEDYRASRRQEYGEFAEEILEHYGAESVEEILGAMSRHITDTWFLRPARAMAGAMSNVSSEAYFYHFTRINSERPSLGANHAAEIGYVFNTMDLDDAAQADRDIAEAMIGHWVQFAETGDPNREGLLEWPAYEPGSDLHMEFGDSIKVGSALRKEACELLDRILAARARDADAK